MIFIDKRNRNIRIVFRVTEQERDLMEQKMKEAVIGNREAYIRKMTLDGYIIHVDLSILRELIYLLRNATNNLNQIARRVNETNNLYEADIIDLQKQYNRLWEKAEEILTKLAAM